MQEELAKKMLELQAMMAGAGMQPSNGMAPAGFAPAAPAGFAPAGFAPAPAAMPGGTPAPVGWSVMMEIPVMGQYGPGKATVDLAYPPETWMQAPQIVAGLIQQGYPVKVWTPQKKQWGPKPPFGGGGGNGWGQ
jgi:hypothetical protein